MKKKVKKCRHDWRIMSVDFADRTQIHWCKSCGTMKWMDTSTYPHKAVGYSYPEVATEPA